MRFYAMNRHFETHDVPNEEVIRRFEEAFYRPDSKLLRKTLRTFLFMNTEDGGMGATFLDEDRDLDRLAGLVVGSYVVLWLRAGRADSSDTGDDGG